MGYLNQLLAAAVLLPLASAFTTPATTWGRNSALISETSRPSTSRLGKIHSLPSVSRACLSSNLKATATFEEQKASLLTGDTDSDRRKLKSLRRQEGLQDAAIRTSVDLHYVELGTPDSPQVPVLILHGLLGSSRNFVSWATALSDRLENPRRILMPDLRNHGESPHHRSMGYVGMATDVIRLLDSLGIDKICVIGHSMGGKVAATLALLHPERVESVGILDIAPTDYGPKNGKQSETWKDIGIIISALKNLPVAQLKDKKEADAILSETIEDPILRAFALTNLVRDTQLGGWRWRIGIDAIWRNMGNIGGFDLGQGLQYPASDLGLSFPRDTYFVQGGKSQFIRSRDLPEIQALFPNYTLQTIRNAGHWVHSEDPETTLVNVKRFLDRPNPTPF